MPADQRAKDIAPTAQDSEGQIAECAELEDALGQLRASYEQYFMGVDRHPPLSQHTRFRQRLERLKSTPLRNSAVRFRVGNLAQKASTYERLWSRTLVEIENGVYRRDLFKVRRKLATQKPGADKAEKTAAPTAPATPQATAPPEAAARASPPGIGGPLTDEKVRAIYNAYVDAKRQCNEDTSKLTFDALANTLRKQAPDLMKRHQAQSVDFKVVIKDGKAVLRAVPK